MMSTSFISYSDDIHRVVDELKAQQVACEPVEDQGWGLLTQLHLPGGGKLGVYEPRHVRPAPMS